MSRDHIDYDSDTESQYKKEKIATTLHKTMTQEERQLLHPLELNDKLAFDIIKTVRLDFLTQEAKVPIRRCQALPSNAFARLTGRSILVSISHGWLFQAHPDPFGVKFDLIKNVFAPQLRERYPHTDIQVFYDYMSLPQEPRVTDEEEEMYQDGVHRMNSMYVYADVILFLKIEDLPKVDMTVYTATIDITKYSFSDYIDTVQVFRTDSDEGPQVFDSILMVGDLKVESVSQICRYVDEHTVKYHRRPHGRPNTTADEKRGWLYLERIVTVMKAAAADKSRFDDIVMSNSSDLATRLLLLSERVRNAAKKQKTNPRALRDLLSEFEDELKVQVFSTPFDRVVVHSTMSDMIKTFSEDWKGEVEKQKTMGKRAREILLRWGCFSENYVERAELLCDSERRNIRQRSWVRLCFLVGLVTPMISMLPFLFSLESDDKDPSKDALIVSSVWLACILRYV